MGTPEKSPDIVRSREEIAERLFDAIERRLFQIDTVTAAIESLNPKVKPGMDRDDERTLRSSISDLRRLHQLSGTKDSFPRWNFMETLGMRKRIKDQTERMLHDIEQDGYELMDIDTHNVDQSRGTDCFLLELTARSIYTGNVHHRSSLNSNAVYRVKFSFHEEHPSFNLERVVGYEAGKKAAKNQLRDLANTRKRVGREARRLIRAGEYQTPELKE